MVCFFDYFRINANGIDFVLLISYGATSIATGQPFKRALAKCNGGQHLGWVVAAYKWKNDIRFQG